MDEIYSKKSATIQKRNTQDKLLQKNVISNDKFIKVNRYNIQEEFI